MSSLSYQSRDSSGSELDIRAAYETVLRLGPNGVLDILASDDGLMSQFMSNVANDSAARYVAIDTFFRHSKSRKRIIELAARDDAMVKEINRLKDIA